MGKGWVGGGSFLYVTSITTIKQISNIQGAILKSFKFKQILKLCAQQIWMSFCLVVNLNLPDFVLSVWRQIIQGSDVEPELFALREFAETGSKGN